MAQIIGTIVFFILLIVLCYALWSFYKLLKIPKEHWDEYQTFEGNGRSVMLDEHGNLVSIKYKTEEEDMKRFLSGLRVLKLHDD